MSNNVKTQDVASQPEDLQKYAYAEVISGDESESWFLPLLEKSGAQKMSHTKVSKQSLATFEEKVGAQAWVEPRLAFKDLLAWLDMNIWHKRCVYAKAAVTVGMGWRLVTDDEDKEPDAAHEAITKYLKKPNENSLDSFSLIAFKSMVDYEATGNFVNEVSMTLGGELGNMYHQRMANFRVARKRNGGFYQVPQQGYSTSLTHFTRWGMREAGKNQLLHYYTYDPTSDYYGMPVWVPALADMLLDRSAVEFNINLFRNQLVAKFAVIVEGGKLSPAAKQSLRQFLSSQATGAKNAGRTLIFDTDDPNVKVKIEKLEMDFGDKNGFMGKTRETARDMTISAHGVPPRIVGVVTAGQLGAGGEADSQLRIWEETDRAPERERINDFYNRTIIAGFGEHKWRLEFNGIDTTDRKMDAEIEQILKQAGIKLPEESRQDLGLPQLDDEGMQRLGAGAAGLEQNVNSLIELRKRLESSSD